MGCLEGGTAKEPEKDQSSLVVYMQCRRFISGQSMVVGGSYTGPIEQDHIVAMCKLKVKGFT